MANDTPHHYGHRRRVRERFLKAGLEGMEFPYRPALVEHAGQHFDALVAKISARDFRIRKVPEPGICKECDLRSLCRSEGLITMAA